MLLIAVFVLFIGCFCIAILLKTKWPGWLGVPLILVVLSAIRDLGLTPIAGLFFERYWINPMVGVAGRGEIIPASILILLNVTAITFGMILANCLKGNASPHNKNLTMQTYHSKRVYSRAWNASSLLFVLGIFCHTIVLFYLLREMNFIDIARTRALYSAKQATITPMYSYARLISSVTMIGAWGMLLFYDKKKDR